MVDSQFFFRGAIHQEADFHLVGVIREDGVSLADQFFQANTPSPYNSGVSSPGAGEFFYLCKNQFSTGGTKYQRLYWSNDPADFYPNINHDTLNQGVADMKYIYNYNHFSFLYNNQMLSGSNFTIPKSNIPKTMSSAPNRLLGSDQDKSVALQLTQSKKGTNAFNIDSKTIYASVPYEITIKSGSTLETVNNIQWSFRLNGNYTQFTTGTGTSGVHRSDYPWMNEIVETSTSNKFETRCVYKLGTSHIPGSSSTVSPEGTSIVINNLIETDFSMLQNFEPNDSIVQITDMASGGESYWLRYQSLTLHNQPYNTATFTLANGASGTSSLLTTESKILTTFGSSIWSFNQEQRNNSEPFVTAPSNIGGNTYNNVSNWMDIYFIPSKTHAYFSDNVVISNNVIFPIDTLQPTSTSGIQILSPYKPYSSFEHTSGKDLVTGYQHINYRSITNLFTLSLWGYTPGGPGVGILRPDFWRRLGYQGYSSIGQGWRDSSEGDDQVTLFAWTWPVDAAQSFMYGYCIGNNTCGDCYGLGLKGEVNCSSDSKTRAIVASQSNDPPLVTENSRSQGESDTHNYVSIAALVFLGLIVILLIVVFMHITGRTKPLTSLKIGKIKPPVREAQEERLA